jgi:branched-chain amino acid transport system substrate-binding protein
MVNADCKGTGPTAICRKSNHTCVELTSQDCTRLIGTKAEFANDDAIVLGSLLPTVGPDSSFGIPTENSIGMAQSDFSAFAGLPPATASGNRRPLVVVGCNDSNDADRAAKHLVDVGVPAIIGPAFSGVTIDVANTVTIPAGVMLMSPSATSTLITDLPDKGLVWRTSPPDTLQATALSLLVAGQVEPAIRSELGLTPAQPIKVGIVYKNDGYGKGLSDSLFKQLIFNGKDAATNQTDGNFKTVTYGNPDTDPAPDYAGARATMLSFQPHLMIVIAISEGISEILTPIEAQWTLPAYRPHYLYTDGGQIPELVKAVGSNAGLRQRILGTVPGTTGQLYQIFRTNYLATIKDGTSPDVFGTAGAYDATYLLAYSISSLGDAAITGTSMAGGMAKLVPPMATPLDVGSGGINQAFTTLGAGQKIDFNGASGPLNFDLKTGEAPSDIQVWCFTVSAGAANGFKDSGLYFDAASGKMTGTLVCN